MLAALGASALPLPAFAATPRSDPEWVLALLTTLHPGLYRYQTPAAVRAAPRRLRRAVGARPSAIEARYLLLSRLLAAIRCGHSYVNPYNQTKATIAQPDRRAAIAAVPFPLDRRRDGGDRRSARSRARAGHSRRCGSMRQSSREILAALMPLARADGGNDAKRRDLMEVRGEDEYEAFDLFYPVLFGDGTAGRPVADPSRRTARAADRSRRSTAPRGWQRARPTHPRAATSAVWTFERRGSAALLTMPGWALYDSKWDWKGWLDQRFAEMARDRVRGLVIDLRANEGGLDCGDEIIARLIDRPLARRGGAAPGALPRRCRRTCARRSTRGTRASCQLGAKAHAGRCALPGPAPRGQWRIGDDRAQAALRRQGRDPDLGDQQFGDLRLCPADHATSASPHWSARPTGRQSPRESTAGPISSCACPRADWSSICR